MMSNEIGKRIRKLRNDSNLSMEKFSEYLGISKSFLSDVELGKSSIGAENIVKICSKCNISCDYLLMGVQSFGKVNESIAERLSLLPPKYNDYILDMIDNVSNIIETTKDDFNGN